MRYRIDILYTDRIERERVNFINDLLHYAGAERGWHVRTILFSHIDNTEQLMLFSTQILLFEEGYSLFEMKNQYAELLEGEELPELVIAVDLPNMVMLGKEVLASYDVSIPVVSWLSISVADSIIAGYGGYEALYFADSHIVSEEWITKEIKAFLPNGKLIQIQKSIAADTNRKWTVLADLAAKLEACIYGWKYLAYFNGEAELYAKDMISVIVPLYNAEKYIARTLHSIIASRMPRYLFEVIVVDDASTDNSLIIAKGIEREFPENILIVQCSENGGEGSARNIGMKYASGNYFSFVDADDIIKPEMLSVLYERVVLFDCDITGCDYTFSESEDINIQKVEDRLYDLSNLQDRRYYFIENGWRASVCVHLYKAAIISDMELRFPHFRVGADLYFQQLFMLVSNRDFECSMPLYIYCQNEGSTIHTYNPQKLLDAVNAQEAVYRTVITTDLLLGIEKEFEAVYYIRGFSFYVRQMLILGEFDKKADEYRMLRRRLLNNFPDIRNNPYILADQSTENMEMFELLLE